MTPLARSPRLVPLMRDFASKVCELGVEASLVQLLTLRASQINGCAACVHLHQRAARRAGERPERLYRLHAWRGSFLYTRRERAALAWAESLTCFARSRAPEHVYAEVKACFSDDEAIALNMLISVVHRFGCLATGYQARPLIARGAA